MNDYTSLKKLQQFMLIVIGYKELKMHIFDE